MRQHNDRVREMMSGVTDRNDIEKKEILSSRTDIHSPAADPLIGALFYELSIYWKHPEQPIRTTTEYEYMLSGGCDVVWLISVGS